MPDFIGTIEVPEVAPSGTFPFMTDYPHGSRIEPQVAIHEFISGNAKIEQRFLLGSGARRWFFQWADMYEEDLANLFEFWEVHKGHYRPFTLTVPTEETTTGTTDIIVRFANQPLTFDRLRTMITRTGVEFVEVPQDYPTYPLVEELERFPSEALELALCGQAQELIPLIYIRVKSPTYPDIFLSDRKCTIGETSDAETYLPRLLVWDGISQRLGSQSDVATFVFGNADRVMRDLAADVDLFRASIEFALYHVGTGVKVNLWKGQITDYESTSQTEFSIQAVDGLYELTLQYPLDKVSPACWKEYDDGRQSGCPFTDEGALDLINFPDADAARCDHGFITKNGCAAHGMRRYFGGVIATPQSVRVKDNTQGFFGVGRPTQTATSLVSDSMQGQPLIEVFTDIPMPVKALICAGRDEGDFYSALGIACAGPIGQFGGGMYDSGGNRLFHKLDGQPNHGDPGRFGLREGVGSNPATETDFFSLDQSGDQTKGDPEKVFSGNSTYDNNFAAGVAFVVIRRVDEKGFQLTTLEEHDMEVWIGEGLKGWVWNDDDSDGEYAREFVPLSNPVWIAVNVYLRGIGKRFAEQEEAEELFDVAAAIFAADICDLEVEKLIGEGTEIQFKFQGVLRDVKVLKDWIQEILNSCLGYYLFSAGKLKIGIREDAAAAHSFSGGNMIYGSLSLKPIKPTFNRLVVNFANRDYNFVADTIPIQDLDHIAYLQQTLDSQMNLVGAAGKSMAGRIGTVRLREELGGVGFVEWKRARVATWRTTILALGVEPGQGVSIDDEEVPNETGLFRITGWRLNPDYSIDLEGRTITDTMYDIVAGPKAEDVPANGVPGEFFPVPLRSTWCPNQETPHVDDAFFEPTDKNFGLLTAYALTAGGDQQVVVQVFGSLPVNDFINRTQPPIIRAQDFSDGESTGGGGELPGGRLYFAAVCATKMYDGRREFSPPSNLRMWGQFEDVLTDFNSIQVSEIEWPADPPAGEWDGWVLFVGDAEQTMCMQIEADVAGSSSLPNVIDFPGPLKESTYNMPSPAHRAVRAKVKYELHGGVVGVRVSDVDSGTGTIYVSDLLPTSDDWNGRKVTLFTRGVDMSAPLLNFLITSYAPGQMQLDPDPIAAGIAIDDILVIRYEPNIFTDLTIGDTGAVNGIYPTGFPVDAEIGYLVRAITPGRPHQLRRIVSNSSDTYTVDRPWDFEPEYFIVESPTWPYEAQTSPVRVASTGVPATLHVVTENLILQPVVVGAFNIDRRLNETDEQFVHIRETYILGEPQVPEPNFWIRAILAGLAPHVTGASPPQEDILEHRYHVKMDEGIRVRLIRVTVTAKEKPTAGPLRYDHLVSTDAGETFTTIYASGETPELPANEQNATYEPTWEVPYLNDGDQIRIDCLEADGVGAGVELVLHCVLEAIA